MSGYTRLSCLIWEWPRLNQLEPTTRLLWLALFTSPPAKRGVPALWHGSVITMAEAARLPVDETARSLDTLLDHDLAEYDAKALVLRLTELPDAGEWPSNPGILDSWYKRFRMVPECGVRNAHVTTIRWMIERGALESEKNGGRPSIKHEEVWKKTFGTVPIPPARKRGMRRFADNNDTGNEVQPSLFAQTPSPEVKLSTGASTRSGFRDPNDFNVRETLCRGSGEGEGEGVFDLGKDQDLDGPRPPGPSQPPDLSGGRDRDPDPLAQLLAMFADVFGGTWNVAQMTPERGLVSDQVERLGEVDYALLGRWVKSRGTSHAFARELLSVPGRLVWAVSEAHRWQAAEDDRRAKARAMKAALDLDLAAVGLAVS